MENLGTFARWRYVLALAVSSGTERQSSAILRTLTEWNVGAASWLVKTSVASSLGTSRETEPELPSWKEVGKSIHTISNTWSSALGQAAPLAFPVDASESIERHWTLGIAVEEDGCTINYTWERRGRIDAEVAHITRFPPASTSIFPYSFSRISGNQNWVWHWTQHRAKERLAKSIAHMLHLRCPAGSVVEKEHVWFVVCSLMGSSRFDTLEFRVDSILAKIAQLKAQVRDIDGPVDNYAFKLGGREVTKLDLALTLEYIENHDSDRISPVWPGADILEPQGGWVWDFYSPARLTQLVTAVYEGALEAYLEITKSFFSRFGFSLSRAAAMPATLTGKLALSAPEKRIHPVLSYRLVPKVDVDHSRNSVEIVLAGEGEETWQSFDSYRRQLDRHYRDNPDRSAFPDYSWTSTALSVWGPRPATKIALQWLWQDLSALGWLPQLRPHDVLSRS